MFNTNFSTHNFDGYFRDICKRIKNTERLKIALQDYNFGNSYAAWVLENYGSYTVENATEFSLMMQEALGWSSYGDPEYVEHVLRYYVEP